MANQSQQMPVASPGLQNMCLIEFDRREKAELEASSSTIHECIINSSGWHHYYNYYYDVSYDHYYYDYGSR